MKPNLFSATGEFGGEMPLACLYVLTYDGKRFLERCFESLKLTDYENYRVILVDNGSSDGSGDYVRENFPDVDILRISPNVGYARGANRAVADAQRRGAKYVALLNDDIEILHPEWLREAIAHAERDPSVGIIGFIEGHPENEEQVEPESKLTEVDYLSGFAMVIPLDLFNRIGTFDEGYFAYSEEDDLGARAQAAGYRLVWLGIPIYHFGSGTNQNFKTRTAFLQMRNGIRFCLKNRSATHALLRAMRIIDVACNPWPITFDNSDVAHRRMRNSGNVLVNLWLWLRAVTWNIVRIRQTLRRRAAERRLIEAALVSRNAQPQLHSHLSRRRRSKPRLEHAELGEPV